MAVIMLVLGLLPAGRLKNALLGLTGHATVARSARVHPVLLWRVGRLVVGERGYIGPGNAFRALARVELGDEAEIGQFNWFSAASSYVNTGENDLAASLIMESLTAITSRHYVDCSGGLKMHRLAILGGVRSTVLSHSVESRRWEIHGNPVVIGEGSIILSHALVNPGVTISERIIVAGGAVVARDLDVSGRLYGGVPAKVIGDISETEHMTRDSVRVVPREDVRKLRR